MDAEFWNQRWRDGRIGFHQEQVTPLLEQYWDSLAVAPGARVLVPLAGKSLDMPWLAARGHRVLGIELSTLAVEQFFSEHELSPTMTERIDGVHYSAGAIELICGDVFKADGRSLASCDAVYDRAAMIALPPPLRARYADALYARLPSGCRGLLVTLEYPQDEKAGPPFSVSEDEVRARYARDWTLDLLERRDILAAQPGFTAEGVSNLHTCAWRMQRR
jgi:thiopurine S-methyltransferase